MKTILSFLFLFVCAFAHAQYHNVEGIRVVGRSDSTTISNVGQIQFDADDDKFRFNDGTGWYSFLKDDTTLPYWPLTGTAAITGNTTITGGQNSLILGHATTGSSKFASFSLFSGDGSNISQRFQMNSTSISSQYSNSSSDRSLSWSIGATGYQMTNDSVDVVGRLFLFADKLQFNVGSDRVVRFSSEIADIKSTDIKITDPAELDTAAWVLVRENSTGQIKKRSVISLFDGIEVPEGANKTMGIATLSSGTVTVNTTAVTANSRIFLTINGGTLTNVGTPYVSARNAGTSFTITSTNGSDASDVAWLIIEPF